MEIVFFSFSVLSEQISSSEPPNKLPHYEQLDSSSNMKKLSKSRQRPLSKFSIENTTPILPPLTSSITIDTSGITKKRNSAETANAAILSRKRRTITKLISNENIKQELLSDRVDGSITIDQIDDELLRRLSQGKEK
jgi:hypothetical protein